MSEPLAERHLSEIEIVQNPPFGAVLLWGYGRSYQDTTTADASHLLLSFLILPLCLHRPTLSQINGTYPSSGLGKFCEKLSSRREELFAVHERALTLRELTFNSLAFGIRSGLLSVNYETATFRAIDAKPPALPERILPHTKGASKLGIWFRALDVIEIFKALRVDA